MLKIVLIFLLLFNNFLASLSINKEKPVVNFHEIVTSQPQLVEPKSESFFIVYLGGLPPDLQLPMHFKIMPKSYSGD